MLWALQLLVNFLLGFMVKIGFDTPCENSILAFWDTGQLGFDFQQGQHISESAHTGK